MTALCLQIATSHRREREMTVVKDRSGSRATRDTAAFPSSGLDSKDTTEAFAFGEDSTLCRVVRSQIFQAYGNRQL